MVRRTSLVLAYAIAGLWFVRTGVHPYQHARQLTQQANGLEKQLQAAQRRHDALERRVELLQTPQGEEAAARTYGWLTKGEIAIACRRPNTPLSHTSDPQILAVLPSPAPSALDRLKQAVEW